MVVRKAGDSGGRVILTAGKAGSATGDRVDGPPLPAWLITN